MLTSIGRFVACIAILLVSAIPTAAQDEGISREYPIKAAYLYNFCNFVEWPDEAFVDANAPFVIGVLGRDPFGKLLDQIAAKKVGGRAVVVKRFSSAADIENCHLLFISSALTAEQVGAALAKLSGSPTLLVGESPQFAERGGVIGFRLQLNKVKFDINPQTAKQRHLKVSSKLLSLAHIVGGP